MSAAPVVHRFAHCELHLYPETRYCTTVFRDGSEAPATRENTMQNTEYARHLGYRDTWPALVEHEAGHTYVAEMLGMRVSPTLWAVAHGHGEGTAPYEAQLAEEAVVLELQRYIRTREVGWALRHPEVAPHLDDWASELRGLTTRLLMQCTRQRAEAA